MREFISERKVNHKYTSFPLEQRSAPGTVAASFGACPLLPEYRVDNGGNEILWKTDAKFVPYHDNMLITSVAAYRERPGQTNVGLNERVNGLICRWTFNGPTMDCDIKRGTDSKAVPHVCALKNGLGYTHINRGKITFRELYEKHAQNLIEAGLSIHSGIKFAAVSPKKNTLAYITRSGSDFSLTIYRKDSFIIFHQTVPCREICSSFIGTRSYTEEVECAWSPDEEVVGLCSSMGHLLFLTPKNLKTKCNVIPGKLDITDKALASPRAYAFHPIVGHNIVSLCCNNNVIYSCDIDKENIINERTLEQNNIVTCVEYNNGGTELFLATNEAIILVLDPTSLDTLYSLDGVVQGPHSFPEPNPDHAVIYRMDFSTFDDYLATSSSDGIIRVWTLCVDPNLAKICRKRILSLVPVSKVDKLPIPQAIKDFLCQKKNFDCAKNDDDSLLSQLRIRLF